MKGLQCFKIECFKCGTYTQCIETWPELHPTTCGICGAGSIRVWRCVMDKFVTTVQESVERAMDVKKHV